MADLVKALSEGIRYGWADVRLTYGSGRARGWSSCDSVVWETVTSSSGRADWRLRSRGMSWRESVSASKVLDMYGLLTSDRATMGADALYGF